MNKRKRPPDVLDEMTADIEHWYRRRAQFSKEEKPTKWRWLLEQVAHSVWEETEVDIGRPVVQKKDARIIYGILHTTSVTSKYRWSVRLSKNPNCVLVTYMGRYESLL